MRRSFVLSLIIFGLLTASLVGRRGDLLALAFPFVVYLVASLLLSPPALQVHADRRISQERVSPGQPVDITLTLTNQSQTNIAELLVTEELPGNLELQQGALTHLLRLPAGAKTTWTYRVAGLRGAYPERAVHITAPDPFGLSQKIQNLPAPGTLLVTPRVLSLKSIIIRPRRTRVYSGLIPARLGGSGTDFYGVRDYQEGDPPRWINWRASARNASLLYSNEFEQERVADVGIVLDGRNRANLVVKKRSLFEESVTAAASLADAFLAQGNRVGLLLYGRYLSWTVPGYGKLQREQLLRAMALAQPGDSQIFADLDHIPTRLFPMNSQIVLVSPLLNGDLDILTKLRARGYPVIVVSPDPVAFELRQLAAEPANALAGRLLQLERAYLLQRLKRVGIQVVDWDVDRQSFDSVVQRVLGHSPAWLRAIEGLK